MWNREVGVVCVGNKLSKTTGITLPKARIIVNDFNGVAINETIANIDRIVVIGPISEMNKSTCERVISITCRNDINAINSSDTKDGFKSKLEVIMIDIINNARNTNTWRRHKW